MAIPLQRQKRFPLVRWGIWFQSTKLTQQTDCGGKADGRKRLPSVNSGGERCASEGCPSRKPRKAEYVVAYSHLGCHRTSNLVDRLMNRLTRFLYDGRGLHGHRISSERRLRGWALLQNFRPFAPRSGQVREFQSPAQKLSRRQYHPHWLHNLQVCASLAGGVAAT